MSIYEKTNVARALLYWAKNNNGHEAYYLEDRMYAVADGDMVILLTADSYDEAIRKAKARHTHAKGEWIRTGSLGNGNAHYECSECHYGDEHAESQEVPYCWHCGAEMKGGAK